MNCPFLDDSPAGLCLATESPHMPAQEERERHCLSTRFTACAHYAVQEPPVTPGLLDDTEDR